MVVRGTLLVAQRRYVPRAHAHVDVPVGLSLGCTTLAVEAVACASRIFGVTVVGGGAGTVIIAVSNAALVVTAVIALAVGDAAVAGDVIVAPTSIVLAGSAPVDTHYEHTQIDLSFIVLVR
jgi:hypothetical protein